MAESMRDRRGPAARPDVLVYETEPLTQDLDVFPDGWCQFVQEGIGRARWRESDVIPSLIEPGELYEYTIDLWATAHVIAPVHRLLIEVSSNNFDRYDRNPDTGHPFGQDAERRPAVQTVFHDTARPSRIALPVLDRSAR